MTQPVQAEAEGARGLARRLEGSRRAVVFTGAGVSTKSGIPDFRSPGGIWSQYRPITFDEFLGSDDGNTTYARCLGCGARHELDAVRDDFERTGRAPRCGACGGHVARRSLRGVKEPRPCT